MAMRWPRSEGQPGDLAVYAVPARDDANGFDSWTEIIEAIPVARVRAVDQGRTDLYVRVDSLGRLIPNIVEAIEIDRYEDEESK